MMNKIDEEKKINEIMSLVFDYGTAKENAGYMDKSPFERDKYNQEAIRLIRAIREAIHSIK